MTNLITPKGGWTGNEIQSPATDGEMLCPNCQAHYRPGFTMCSDCKVPLISAASAASSVEEESESEGELTALLLKGLKCAQHPEIDAVSRCRKCSTGVCNTCDFHISAGVHFCPACIDSADDQKVSPRRKQLAIGSIFVAVYCTLLGIITFSGALYQAMGGAANAREIGLFVMYGVYIPSVIGTALASCAFERRLKNTNLIWIGLIWNGALTGLFIVMEVAARLTR